MNLKARLLGWLLAGALEKDGIRRKLVMWKAQREVNKMNLKGSWRTTGSGAAVILTALAAAVTALSDNDPNTQVNVQATITALVAGFGLIMARDNKVSSEDAGIK